MAKIHTAECIQTTLFEVEEYWDFNYVERALRLIDYHAEIARLSRVEAENDGKTYSDEEVPI